MLRRLASCYPPTSRQCPAGNKKGLDFTLSPCFIGAGERIRTPDPLITNQLLYQLSYAGVWLESAGRFASAECRVYRVAGAGRRVSRPEGLEFVGGARML
jgi:hypothetical protein